MKTLYLIRHAKSSWKYPHLDDIDRPLNKRGRRDAPDMGMRLKSKSIHPDLIISSPANRAHTASKIIAEALSYPVAHIMIDDSIYHGSENALLAVVNNLDDKLNTIFLFGHNPGFTMFANSLTNSDLWNIPTSGIFGCNFDINSWKNVQWGTGKIIFYDYPKSSQL